MARADQRSSRTLGTAASRRAARILSTDRPANVGLPPAARPVAVASEDVGRGDAPVGAAARTGPRAAGRCGVSALGPAGVRHVLVPPAGVARAASNAARTRT